MPPETMNENETQTAAPAEETVQQDSPESVSASETDAPIENESQEQPQEDATEPTGGDNAPDDQPVTAPADTATTLAARYASVEKENSEMRAAMREYLELAKAEKQATLAKQSEKAVAPKGVWKEALAKAYKPEDATVLSGAIEAALAERLGDVEQMKQKMDFYIPHIDRMGMDREFQKGADYMVAQGVPASVVAALRPKVEQMVANRFAAPPEVLFQAAYAEHAMKQSKAHATKTLEARNAAAKKPVAPAPKNTTGVSTPKYAVPKEITDRTERTEYLLAQFEKYKE